MTTNNAEALRALLRKLADNGELFRDDPALHLEVCKAHDALASQPQAAVAGGDAERDAASIIDALIQCAEVGRYDGKTIGAAKDWLSHHESRLAAAPAPAVEREAKAIATEALRTFHRRADVLIAFPHEGGCAITQAQYRDMVTPLHDALTRIATIPPAEAREPVAGDAVDAKCLARDIHYALADDGLAPLAPVDSNAMRETILRVLLAARTKDTHP